MNWNKTTDQNKWKEGIVEDYWNETKSQTTVNLSSFVFNEAKK